MTTSSLLSEAFSKYDLEIPPDICTVVSRFLKKEPHICCNYCKLDLLEIAVIKPFVRHIPVYYKLNYGRVFTFDGMLTSHDSKNSDIETDVAEGVLTLEKTPDVLSICGAKVKNEIIRYEQTNWYKCLYSENEFIYLCSHCFLFTKRKMRLIFHKWKTLSSKV